VRLDDGARRRGERAAPRVERRGPRREPRARDGRVVEGCVADGAAADVEARDRPGDGRLGRPRGARADLGEDDFRALVKDRRLRLFCRRIPSRRRDVRIQVVVRAREDDELQLQAEAPPLLLRLGLRPAVRRP
jgi:hypothetical protein